MKPNRHRHVGRVAVSLAVLACIFTQSPVDTVAAPSIVDELVQQEDYVRAFDLATRTLETTLAEHPLRSRETIDALHDVARAANSAGERDVAETLYKMLVTLDAEVLGEQHIRVAECDLALASIARLSQWKTDVADDYLDRAREIVAPKREEQPALYARLLNAQANINRWQHFQDSDIQYRESLELRRETLTSPHFDIAGNLTWLGWTLVHMGRHEEALAYLDEAAEELRALGLDDHSFMGTIYGAKADVFATRGEWRRAEASYIECTRRFEIARGKNLPGFARMKSPLHGYNLLAVAQLKQGRERDAWNSLQRQRSNLSVDYLNLYRWREIEPASYQRVRELREEYLHNLRSSPSQLHATEEEVATLARQLRLRAQISNIESEYLRGHEIPTVGVAHLRDQLPDGTAYIGWLEALCANDIHESTGPTFMSMWGYVVRRDRPIQWVELACTHNNDDEQRFRGAGKRYRRMWGFIESWGMQLEPDPRLDRQARELGKKLFEPLQAAIGDARSLVVEYSGWPTGVPVENLMLADGSYVIDQYDITYSPSATAYVILAARKRHDSSPGEFSALAIGDPVFSPDGYAEIDYSKSGRIAPSHLRSAISRDPQALNSLPRLPYSGMEVQRIGELFSRVRSLVGDDASEPAIGDIARSGELARYDVVHMATHALMDFHPGRCAFALSRTHIDNTASNDGLLDTWDVFFGWDLNAKVLTLSGCQTAFGGGWCRGEPVGFLQVLLAAGASDVVSSWWKMDDRACAMTMSRFYENLTGRFEGTRRGYTAAPLPAAAALAEAKVWLRDFQEEDGSKPFEHPIYWSGFVLTGVQ